MVESRFSFLTGASVRSKLLHGGSSADYPKFVPGRSRRVQHIANLGVTLFSWPEIERNRSLVHQQCGIVRSNISRFILNAAIRVGVRFVADIHKPYRRRPASLFFHSDT